MDQSVVDGIIRRLLQAREESSFEVPISGGEIRKLCVNSRNIFLKEPSLLQLKAPIRIAGDIHGQYGDLLRLFETCGYPPDCTYLFLGNYVDFGGQSLETICLLFAYKIRYPSNIFLLRGNHEDVKINRIHGFYDDCERRFNVGLWKIFNDCFKCLPIAALVQHKMLCMHGGISPELHNLDQIRNIGRPTDVPNKGLLFDLLWSRLNYRADGWGKDIIDEISVNTFGNEKVIEFLDKHDLDLICRGNQMVKDGYEFFAKRRLVTLFSVPIWGEYANGGAILHVDENLVCSFDILHPRLTEMKTTLSNGISNPSVTDKSVNSPGVNPSTSKAASKNRSASPGYMPAERMRNSNIGSNSVTGKPESSQEGRPFKIDPATLYRSKSPGVKRFLGARV